ncbi:MAG: hypothetical protein B6I25_00250 [Planctomycetales bacterium 4572_13]|nr:MAG: hypothetical protein B6I25_00250 [Planctomycetales bacterium 4572_13]
MNTNEYKFNLLFLIAGLAICFMDGCQESHSEGVSNGSAGALDGPHQMAVYMRGEPAVKDAQIWKNNYAPGLKIQTRNYTVCTTLLEPLMLRQLPAFLESAYKAYQSQLPRMLNKTRPLEVYLFATRGQWEQFTRDTAGADAEIYLKIQRGAYTLNGIVVAYNIGRKQTFSVIGHEGWHQFNQRLFVYRLPSWLDEGIATLFETCRYHQGRFLFEPSRNLMRLGSLKRTIQRRQLIPLRQLVVLNPGQVLNGHGSDDAVVAFYAQNYALVRFLREYQYGIRLRNYHALLLGGADGSWPVPQNLASLAADRTRPLTVGWNTQISPILFTHYIEREIDRIEKEYREFCGKIVYRIRLK